VQGGELEQGFEQAGLADARQRDAGQGLAELILGAAARARHRGRACWGAELIVQVAR